MSFFFVISIFIFYKSFNDFKEIQVVCFVQVMFMLVTYNLKNYLIIN